MVVLLFVGGSSGVFSFDFLDVLDLSFFGGFFSYFLAVFRVSLFSSFSSDFFEMSGFGSLSSDLDLLFFDSFFNELSVTDFERLIGLLSRPEVDFRFLGLDSRASDSV